MSKSRPMSQEEMLAAVTELDQAALDRALFAAKAAGRDRVLAWAGSMSAGEAMPHPPPGQA